MGVGSVGRRGADEESWVGGKRRGALFHLPPIDIPRLMEINPFFAVVPGEREIEGKVWRSRKTWGKSTKAHEPFPDIPLALDHAPFTDGNSSTDRPFPNRPYAYYPPIILHQPPALGKNPLPSYLDSPLPTRGRNQTSEEP